MDVRHHDHRLLYLSPEEWTQVFQSRMLGERKVSDFFLKKAKFVFYYVEKYDELRLHIVDMGKLLLPRNTVRINNYDQRVFLEKLTCSSCQWAGMTAEPFSMDNYVELPQDARYALLKIAAEFPVLPCPSCGAKLPRHPIWIEY